MPARERHRAVARGYDAIASAYAEASIEHRTASSYYRSFVDRCIALLAPRAVVVDLGCGAGLLASDLVPRLRVLGVDVSNEQLRLARERVPEATLVLADMTELELRAASVDAVAVFWSVIHVERSLHAALFERIHAWLRPGGLLFGTLGADDNPDELDPDFLGAPMTWSHFDAPTNRRLLREAGFALEQDEVVEDMGESPLWVIARA